MRRHQSQLQLDWQFVGFNAMAETRDDARAKVACGLKLQALADELQPSMTHCNSEIAELRNQTQALVAQLYHGHQPVSEHI